MSKAGRQILRGLRELTEMYGYKKKELPFYKAAWEAFYLSKLFDLLTAPYDKVRHIVNKCIKVIQFIPIIWRHEDWDYSYTLEFMHFLFKRLYKGVYIEGHHVEHPTHKRRLKVAVELLRRMSDGEHEYTKAHWQYLEDKYGAFDMGFEKIEDIASGRTYTTLVDRREAKLSSEQRTIYKTLKNNIHKLEDVLYNQDMELFCKIIKKDSRKWWD